MNNAKHLLLFLTLTLFSCSFLLAYDPQNAFILEAQGEEFPINYRKYGSFVNIGSKKHRFKIENLAALRTAVGGGLFPSKKKELFEDPEFSFWYETRPAVINPWDYVNTGDPQTDFFAWSVVEGVKPGVKLFYQAQALAAGGNFQMAIKAYYALFVHFPKTYIWSADKNFVWYPAGKALGEIASLTKAHSKIGYRLVGAEHRVINGKDTDLRNDEFVIKSGRWETFDPYENVPLNDSDIVRKRGKGWVQLVQFKNLQWQMRVEGKPFLVKGITYKPTPVGKSVEDGMGNQWMFSDSNNNGRIDAPYDSWVDESGDGIQDEDEETVGDFELMRQMGVNAIRIYRQSQSLRYNPKEFNKKLLRNLHRRYGIHVIMGDFLGAYTVGSGATWEEGTDYTDKAQLKNMKRLVRQYVLDHRREAYVLMWVLGNENLMPADYSGVNATRTLAARQVKPYLRFVNDIARMIHKLDPNHPVAVGNLGLHHLEEHAALAPEIDIFGTNLYLGETGMGDIWGKIQRSFDRPVLITEYGCDAWNVKAESEDEEAQASYHRGNWRDIYINTAGHPTEGNAIGGVVFEFLDEWWKSPSGSWSSHDTAKDSSMAFPDGWANEEWFGMFSQGEGESSPFLRQPRAVYYLYRDELWSDDKKN